jgi:3-oxoadipate enol-lactonase/4-carboxymuconolactone decarboxylase
MALHVRDLGSGPPVVMLHPGPGLDGSVFLPGAHSLVDAGFRVVLVDLPGSGCSPAVEWTFSAHARAVEQLARELGLDDWTLLGHSGGGFVAMQHLVDFPGSATRLVASDTDAEEEEPPDAPEDRFEGLPEEVADGVRAAFEREDAGTVATPAECLQLWRDQMPFFADDPAAVEPMLAEVLFQVEAHRGHDWGELHALDALAAADIPVLAIAGEHDRPTPPAAARRIASTAPRGELLLVEGAGHFPFAEQPDRYWPALIDWLTRTSP